MQNKEHIIFPECSNWHRNPHKFQGAPEFFPRGREFEMWSWLFKITFYFAEEGPGRASEDIKKEFTVNLFDLFFISLSFMDVMGGKITLNLKELH